MRCLALYEKGKLKGQKLKKKKRSAGRQDIYLFHDLINLPLASISLLLEEFCNNEIRMGELKTEAKSLSRLNRVQQKLLELMVIESRESAAEEYPHETEREVLSQLMTLPLTETAPELRTFCRRLRQRESGDFPSPMTGRMKRLFVRFLTANVEDLALNSVKAFDPNFVGLILRSLICPRYVVFTTIFNYT